MKKVFFVFCFFVLLNSNFIFATELDFADPPRLLDYKKKVISGLQGGFDEIDKMYNARFVDLTEPADATINKRVVYYDSVKALFEFSELVHNTTGLTEQEIALVDQLPEYINKSKKIIAQRYIQAAWGGGGYQAFPHGLGYVYRSSNDTEAYDGLFDLRHEDNWVKSWNPAREGIGYSRDCAYTLQIGITTEKLGINVTSAWSNTDLMNTYLNVVISHLEQWHTGNFYDSEQYRSSFMTGLSMAAAIEYYERINPDSRIPLAVKNVLDDLWNQSWHADVTDPSPQTLGDASSYEGSGAAGGFWTHADWDSDTSQYIVNANKYPSSPDVSATTSQLIGPAYAWYGVYSGDESYMDKALAVFNGTVENLPLHAHDGALWQGVRHSNDFIRWYREFYGATCSNYNIEQCKTKVECKNANGSWNGEWCQHAPCVIESCNNQDFNQIIFEDNFDDQEDWTAEHGIDCWLDCTDAPIGYTGYRTQKTVFSDSGKNNTLNINSINSRGKNGKALTYFSESNVDGSSWASDGLLNIELDPEGYEDLYVRFYMKFQPDWQWAFGNSNMQKFIHISNYAEGSPFVYFENGNHHPLFIGDLARWNGGNTDIAYLSAYRYTNEYYPDNANPYHTGNNNFYFPPNGSYGGDGTDFWDSEWSETGEGLGMIGDGKWHTWEYRLKINSGEGIQDGIHQFWTDGVLIANVTDLAWQDIGATERKLWNYVQLGGNNHNVYGSSGDKPEQWYAIDDLVISTEPIGPAKCFDSEDISGTGICVCGGQSYTNGFCVNDVWQSVLSQACAHEAETKPCDGDVDLNELQNYLGEWANGKVSIQEIFSAIKEWLK